MIYHNYKLLTDIILSDNITMTHSHIDHDINDHHQSIVFIIICLLYIFGSNYHFIFLFIETFIFLLQSYITYRRNKKNK